MTLKNGFGKCSLFVLSPNHEKIKTWALRFPSKENPNMEKALFDWPILLQYDVKAKYRLIPRKFSGTKFFHPIKSLCYRLFVVIVLFARFHFKVIRDWF